MQQYEISTGYYDNGAPVTEQTIFTSQNKQEALDFLNSLLPELRQQWLCEKATGGKRYWGNPPHDFCAELELVTYDDDEPVEWELIDECKYGYDEWKAEGNE